MIRTTIFKIYGLEYLGRPVSKGAFKGKTEAKRFTILKVLDDIPTKDELMAEAKKNPKIKKVWVMSFDKNVWRKVLGAFDVNR